MYVYLKYVVTNFAYAQFFALFIVCFTPPKRRTLPNYPIVYIFKSYKKVHLTIVQYHCIPLYVVFGFLYIFHCGIGFKKAIIVH